MEERIIKDLTASMEVKKSMIENLVPKIKELSEMTVEAYKNGRRVILFGNGGSAADAQHITAELVSKMLIDDRPMLDAIALTVNTSILTAISNDTDYNRVFSRQIESLARPGDIVIGISTSGNSENVIKALLVAKEKGSKTIGWTGQDPRKMGEIGLDLILNVGSDDTPRIQEGHITLGHIFCTLVEEELFGN
jgi:D-sedoheptulose 7-phosphate isomerase